MDHTDTKFQGLLLGPGEVEPDAYDLARLMLRWRAQKEKLDRTEKQIKALVLKARKTQTVGDVRATFNNPRKSYDYETPVKDRLDDPDISDEERVNIRMTIQTCTVPVTNWRDVCKFREIDPVITPGTGPGSVSIKLLK